MRQIAAGLGWRLQMTASGLSHMRPVVEKELLHYDLLFILIFYQMVMPTP